MSIGILLPGVNSANSRLNLGRKAPACPFSGNEAFMRQQVTLEIRAEREMH
jgi:hypothetical protein